MKLTVGLSIIFVVLINNIVQIIAKPVYNTNGTDTDYYRHVDSDSGEMVYQFHLHITQDNYNPDCSNFTIPSYLVNHQSPGPTIRVSKGDRVRIFVHNDLPPSTEEENSDFTVHFHGIRQYQTIQADGVPFLTQAPIESGQVYVHDFRVTNQSGTFFYHAHIGLKEQTVFGAFIINETGDRDHADGALASPHSASFPYKYDDERMIILSEWWHRSLTDFENYLMGPSFDGIPEAESILMNGQTVFDPRQINPDVTCGGYYILDVEPNKTYRLRLVGAATFRTFSFAIAHHNMTIIEVDGDLIQPYEVDILELTAGQRFSVLLHTNQPPRDYLIDTRRRWADETVDRYSNGKAILRYKQQSSSEISKAAEVALSLPQDKIDAWDIPATKFESPGWLWDNMQSLSSLESDVMRPATRTLIFRSTNMRMEDGTEKWFVNEKSFTEPKVPILTQLIQGKRLSPERLYLDTTHKRINSKDATSPDTLTTTAMPNGTYISPYSYGYDPRLGTYPLAHNETIDLVLQNTHIPGEPCRSHPYHTHGHSHWIIARGPGKYSEDAHGAWRIKGAPIHRDISMVYPWLDPELETNPDGTPKTIPVDCGWTKIRIVADNPGIWLTHCHNTAHMIKGMAFVFEESQELIPLRNPLADE